MYYEDIGVYLKNNHEMKSKDLVEYTFDKLIENINELSCSVQNDRNKGYTGC